MSKSQIINHSLIKALQNVRHLLKEDRDEIGMYLKGDTNIDRDKFKSYCSSYRVTSYGHSVVLIGSTSDYALYVLEDVLYVNVDALLEKDVPIIVIASKEEVIPFLRDNKFYVYDFNVIDKNTSMYTLRPYKKVTSFLNFYIQFQEDSEYQRFLDTENANHFMDMLYDVISTFYDIKAKLVYPFEFGGHSGCFILGESHSNWHSYPEQGRIDINISSCTNRNAIPLIRNSLASMFKLDTSKIYSDYKEVEVFFHHE